MHESIVIQPSSCKTFGPLERRGKHHESTPRIPFGVRPVLSGLGRGRLSGRPFLLVAMPLRFIQLTSRTREVLSHTGDALYDALGGLFLGTAIAPPSFDIARLFESQSAYLRPAWIPLRGAFRAITGLSGRPFGLSDGTMGHWRWRAISCPPPPALAHSCPVRVSSCGAFFCRAPRK